MSEYLQEKYYLIKFTILQKEYYTFWYTDDNDGFLLDNNGSLKSFQTKEETVTFAKKEGFLLDTDELLISSTILKNIKTKKIDCNLILNHWNIFSDIAHSINCQFKGDNRNKKIIQQIYEKLFYGCNIFLKEGEKPYYPKWSKKEKRCIFMVMKNGLHILSKGLNMN